MLKAREAWPRGGASVLCPGRHALGRDRWGGGRGDRAALPPTRCGHRPGPGSAPAGPSQFVFTQARGRPAVWWQTQKTVQAANPGARVPRGRALGPLTIAVDTREKYSWRFAGRPVTPERHALAAGDYAAMVDGRVSGVVERKTLENLATSLSDGTLASRCSGWPSLSGPRSWSRAIPTDVRRGRDCAGRERWRWWRKRDQGPAREPTRSTLARRRSLCSGASDEQVRADVVGDVGDIPGGTLALALAQAYLCALSASAGCVICATPPSSFASTACHHGTAQRLRRRAAVDARRTRARPRVRAPHARR